MCRMYENPLFEEEETETDDMQVDGMEVGNTTVMNTAANAATNQSTVKGPSVDRGDKFVLHFYDLAARKPHSLYQFVKS